jgi:hypothetical protein
VPQAKGISAASRSTYELLGMENLNISLESFDDVICNKKRRIGSAFIHVNTMVGLIVCKHP